MYTPCIATGRLPTLARLQLMVQYPVSASPDLVLGQDTPS